MKIVVFSPYLPKHFGGGEKYILDVARVLAAQGHQVDIALAAQTPFPAAKLAEIKTQYETFLGQSLGAVQWVNTPLGTPVSWWQKLWWTRQYDVVYYLTDGSLFFSLASRNILHIQFPFTDSKDRWLDRLKLSNWQIINTNSAFTKTVIENHWRTSVTAVHYPMIDWPIEVARWELQPAKKEKIIINVGRFFTQLHSKRQDVLVEAFQKLHALPAAKGWKLVLIGSVEDEAYAAEISRQAKGLPIEIHHAVSRAELLQWYNRASIYWHAAGYGIDEQLEPVRVEHFGITTVEAMAAGCVPVVLGKGGQREVVGKQLLPYAWETVDECVEKTADVISKPRLRSELSELARLRSAQFGPERFAQVLTAMVAGVTAELEPYDGI